MSEPNVQILLTWHDAHRKPEYLQYDVALYAIVHPNREDILYIGKADGSTVAGRRNAEDKDERVWRRIEEELGLYRSGFIVGEFPLIKGQRLTRQLVCDVESLLIHQVKPWANTSNVKSRGSYSRPGMVVRCQGYWPLGSKTFRDS